MATTAAVAVAAVVATLAPPAAAQVTIKPDGRWRHLVTAGLTLHSGNTRTQAFNLNSDSVNATDRDKWSLVSQWLYASAEGRTSAERAAVATQYNRDLDDVRFLYVQAAGQHDRPANLATRLAASAGTGLHLMKQDDGFWDVWAGVGVSHDRFFNPVETLDGRRRYTEAGLVFAEESSHRVGEDSTLKQKLVLLPGLREQSRWRLEFDSQLTVAINASVQLSVGLNLRRNSDPGDGRRSLDAALVTGLAWRYD